MRALSAVDIYKTEFRPLKATLSGRDTTVLLKLVVDGASDRVLGCHIVAPDAGEMIQLVGIAVKMGATKADFDATMAVHPTDRGGARHHAHGDARATAARRRSERAQLVAAHREPRVDIAHSVLNATTAAGIKSRRDFVAPRIG